MKEYKFSVTYGAAQYTLSNLNNETLTCYTDNGSTTIAANSSGNFPGNCWVTIDGNLVPLFIGGYYAAGAYGGNPNYGVFGLNKDGKLALCGKRANGETFSVYLAQ